MGHGGDGCQEDMTITFLLFEDKYRRNLSTNKFFNDLLEYLNLKENQKLKKKIIFNYLVTLTYQEGSTKLHSVCRIDNFSKGLLNDYISEKFYHMQTIEHLTLFRIHN